MYINLHVASESMKSSFQIHLNTDTDDMNTDDMNTFLTTYVEHTLIYILVLIVIARTQ